MFTFTVIGDVNVDIIFHVPHIPPADGDVEANGYTIEPGGTALNTAAHLKKLGMKVELVACLGNDKWADLVLAYTRELNLRSHFFREKGDTGICLVIETPSNRHLITHRGVNSALEPHLSELMDYIGEGKWVHFSSSEPSLVGVMLDGLHKRGCTVSYDPGGIQVKKIDEKALDALKRVDYLFLNIEEFQQLEHLDPTAQPWKLVLKSGENGASYIERGKSTSARPKKRVSGKSKGAGDAFDAAFMACMASHKSAGFCLEYAVEYATSYLAGGEGIETDLFGSRRSADRE